jgi:hypothetical protein
MGRTFTPFHSTSRLQPSILKSWPYLFIPRPQRNPPNL